VTIDHYHKIMLRKAMTCFFRAYNPVTHSWQALPNPNWHLSTPVFLTSIEYAAELGYLFATYNGPQPYQQIRCSLPLVTAAVVGVDDDEGEGEG
jgi:hypothetical protein